MGICSQETLTCPCCPERTKASRCCGGLPLTLHVQFDGPIDDHKLIAVHWNNAKGIWEGILSSDCGQDIRVCVRCVDPRADCALGVTLDCTDKPCCSPLTVCAITENRMCTCDPLHVDIGICFLAPEAGCGSPCSGIRIITVLL